MSRREQLEALAARVEALAGPCRETDALVAVTALGWIIRAPRYDGDDVAYGYVKDDSEVFPGNGGGNSLVPRFTASFDAAKTLVPDEATWSLQTFSNENFCRGQVRMKAAYAAFPAQALTAAALRALAAQEPTA